MFTRHIIRSVSLLTGLWDFEFLGEIDLEAFDPVRGEGTTKLPVPSAFDALPELAGRRGAAVYRTQVEVPAGQLARLEFGAVSLWSRVFIDGVLAKENACGFAPFHALLPRSERSRREVVVLVDNRFDFNRVPMHEEYFDFYQYGGIIRPVTLHRLPVGAWLDGIRITPTERYRNGEIEVMLDLGGDVSETVTLEVSCDDGGATRQILPVTAGRVQWRLLVPNPRLWAPEAPHLHTLRVVLLDAAGRAGDDLNTRFGLRRIEARSAALWLNGEKLQLRGYNRHEWHPNSGPCTSVLQMLADVQLLKDLGCNFVRGSHYPQDQRFLDLCDEFGLLVWEENLGWGQRDATFQSQKFRQDHLGALAAMVRASYNHPCVIIWGFLNEAGTETDVVRPVLEETVRALRALDASRPISYATMFALTDRHLDLVDVLALNLYPGWYGCEGSTQPLNLIEPTMRQAFEYLDRPELADKPLIVSEIGAEALYGWRDVHHDFFTEEYQAEYLRRACLAALTNPRCSGIALWQFCDVRTYGRGWSLKRPRTFNNKGTLDEYRRPKAAYAAVRDVFRKAAGLPLPALASEGGTVSVADRSDHMPQAI